MKTFNEYLDSLPTHEARALRLAEMAWVRSRRPLNRDQKNDADQAFEEQMYGYEETPAGPRARKWRSDSPRSFFFDIIDY